MAKSERVVWAVPDIIHEECPLPEPWVWQDETQSNYAALKNIEKNEAFAWFRPIPSGGDMYAVFKADRRYATFNKGEEEQAMRYVYAQFLFNRGEE